MSDITHVCAENPDMCFCLYDPECNPSLKRMQENHRERQIEEAAHRIIKLNAPRTEGGMGFKHTHFMARQLARAALGFHPHAGGR